MWRVVTIGPGPRDRPRRLLDKGPLHPDLQRVTAIAAALRATGLYESVVVEGSAVKSAEFASGGLSDKPAPSRAEPSKAGKSIDDLAALLEDVDSGTEPAAT